MGLQGNNRSVWKSTPQKVKVLYIKYLSTLEGSQVLRGTGNPVGIQPDHGLRLNTKV